MPVQSPKPKLPKWQFSPETTCIAEEDYVDLEVVDISSLINDPSFSSVTPEIRRDVIDRALAGFKESGFIVLTGHGLDAETISRQFDIGKMFIDEVSETEKQKYYARIMEEGSWAGYKGFHKRPDGKRDFSEFHDFYPSTVVESQQPPVSWPYLNEIKEFYEYTHFRLLRTVLAMICEGLDIPVDSLWNLHRRQGDSVDANSIHTRDLFRAGIYHPPDEEERLKGERLWLPPHTDRGSLTFTYPQPIPGLQIFIDDRWKYVRYYPGGIVVILGDAMEFTTGRLLKAAVHRVCDFPLDQRHLRRLTLFYFATLLPEIPMQPIEALVTRSDPDPDVFIEFEELKGRAPTAQEWQVKRARATGTAADLALFSRRFPAAAAYDSLHVASTPS